MGEDANVEDDGRVVPKAGNTTLAKTKQSPKYLRFWVHLVDNVEIFAVVVVAVTLFDSDSRLKEGSFTLAKDDFNVYSYASKYVLIYLFL